MQQPVQLRFLTAALLALAAITLAVPSAAPENSVSINSADDFCLIVPRDAYTAIGASEHPGGTTSYCSPAAAAAPSQGRLASNFWSVVDFTSGNGQNGASYVQLTGCINVGTLDRLDAGDAGGQYDSSGGVGGNGNPEGSVCTGFSHYVELIEPAASRACIRCCNDAADCPTNMDTSGCPNVIPGNYASCN